jgi:hypothetical protein
VDAADDDLALLGVLVPAVAAAVVVVVGVAQVGDAVVVGVRATLAGDVGAAVALVRDAVAVGVELRGVDHARAQVLAVAVPVVVLSRGRRTSTSVWRIGVMRWRIWMFWTCWTENASTVSPLTVGARQPSPP